MKMVKNTTTSTKRKDGLYKISDILQKRHGLVSRDRKIDFEDLMKMKKLELCRIIASQEGTYKKLKNLYLTEILNHNATKRKYGVFR